MNDPATNTAAVEGPVAIQRCEQLAVSPALTPECCEVWQIALDAQPSDAALLSEVEKARARGFHFDLHRDRFIAGRSALRRILAEYLQAPPEALLLDTDEWGRPRLAPGSWGAGELDFNVSHSEALAVIAVTQAGPVGIDVEVPRPLPDARALAARFFSPRERRALQPMEGEALMRAFLSCWTRKEALLKSTGVGLRMAPAGVEAGTDTAQRVMPLPGADGMQAALLSFGLEGGAIVAAAVRASTRILRIFPFGRRP
jgi:4'-phosphopantetheinyl transferase